MPITAAPKAAICISLTDFIEFVTKSGASKQTKVKQIKERDAYHPVFDYYKDLRDAIVEMHSLGTSKTTLDTLCNTITDPAKKANYEVLVAAYKSWWGRKTFDWFHPAFTHWRSGEVDIRLNPELGLKWNGTRHLVKIYFKPEKLTKNKADEILSLMENELRAHVQSDDVFALLDIRNRKLFVNPIGDVHLMPLLMGEVGSFETIWNSL